MTDVRRADDRAGASNLPSSIGRYDVLLELASGGMANVFLGRLEGPESVTKLVAIKRVHRHLSSERAFVDMFVDEARIAARLSHPNICTVLDFGKHRGAYFLVMEYLAGETLSTVSRAVADEGPKDWPYLVRMVVDAAAGLHAAHEATDDAGQALRVVHRDVTPQNIFVTYDGAVKVTDFGIAKAVTKVHATAPGNIKGKLSYMSPDQLKTSNVDRRADIWSLGVVAWELLTGRRLFKRKNDIDTILAIRSASIPPASRLAPDIPTELDGILARAIDRNPKKRYDTARAFGRDLKRVLTSHGHVLDSADLGDWMVERFEASRRERRRLVSEAIAASGSREREHPGARDDEVEDLWDEDSDPEPRDTSPSPPPVEPTSDVRPMADEDAATLRLGSEAEPGRDRAAWLLVGASLLLLAVVLGFVIAGSGSGELEPRIDEVADPEPQAAAVDEPTEPEPVAEVEEPAPEPEPVAEVEEPEPESDPEPAPVAATEPEPPVAARTSMRRATMRASTAPRSMRGTPAATGLLNVVTPGGWAEVRYRGRLVGRTPVQVRVPEGRQVLLVRPFGRGADRRVSVDVAPGGLRPVVVPLR